MFLAARLLSGAIASLCCALMCSVASAAAAAEQFRVTVLRSSDPIEVHELLGLQRSTADAGEGYLSRNYRTSGYRRTRHSQWQVVVNEGQAAFVATGSTAPQLQIPLVELTRRGPVPYASLTEQVRVHGFYVLARRIKRDVELQLHQFEGAAGQADMSASPDAGLRTVLRGRPGRWLDAGGTLLLEHEPVGMRRYSLRHNNPQYFRVLVRVDPID